MARIDKRVRNTSNLTYKREQMKSYYWVQFCHPYLAWYLSRVLSYRRPVVDGVKHINQSVVTSPS